MDRSFYVENRRALYARIPGDARIGAFAGEAPRRTADAFYGFFANRNFAYLTARGCPTRRSSCSWPKSGARMCGRPSSSCRRTPTWSAGTVAA